MTITPTNSGTTRTIAALDVRTRHGDATAGLRTVQRVRDDKTQRVEHGSEHHTRDPHGGTTRAEGSRDETRLTLSAKIVQTFATYLPVESDQSEDADGSGAAHFEASFKLSISDHGTRARLKFEMDGNGDGADFASLMNSFVETLHASLQALFGASQAMPTSGANAPAQLPLSAAAGTGAATQGPSPAADSVSDESAANQAAERPVTGTAQLIEDGSQDVQSTALSRNAALSIKVRMTYHSFDRQMGELVQQLASPEAIRSVPLVAPWLDDLSERFDQLTPALARSGGTIPTLGDFLKALADTFKPVATTPPMSSAAPLPTADEAADQTAALPVSSRLAQIAFSMQASTRGTMLALTA